MISDICLKDVGTPILELCQRNVAQNIADMELHGDVLVRELNWLTPFSKYKNVMHIKPKAIQW